MSDPGVNTAAFPQLGTEFVDEHREITIPWYRLLISLWRLAGGSQVPISQAVYFLLVAPEEVEVVSVVSGPIGFLQLQNQPGQPAVPQTLGSSPTTFLAGVTGMMSVFAGKSELSRDGGSTYYPVSLTGAAIPMLKGDICRISWVGTNKPTAVWWPSNT